VGLQAGVAGVVPAGIVKEAEESRGHRMAEGAGRGEAGRAEVTG
jgi:hypothetical protein